MRLLCRGPGGYGANYSDALWDASNGWSSPNLRNGQTFLNGAQINGTNTGLPSDYALVDVGSSSGRTQANALANDRNIAGRQGGQQIGEVILFNSALSAADRVKTEAYLASKWFAQAGATNNVLPTGTPVSMSGGGRLDLSGFNQTIGSLAATDASGTQVLLGAGRLTVGGANHTVFDGAISGTGGLTREGGGTLALNGANTFTDTTLVNSGKLLVNGSLAAGSAVTVAGGATSGGAGTVNGSTTVNSGGGIESTTCTLTLSSLTLGGSATFNIATATGGAVNVTTTNALNASGGAASATVNITGLAPAIGLHTLINYDGALGGGIGAFALGSLPNRVLATLAHDSGNTIIQIDVTGSDFPIWSGAAGSMSVAAGGVTVDTGNGNIVVNSVISGAGTITKLGGSTLRLTAANTQTGDVFISGGIVRLASAGGPAILGKITFTNGGFTVSEAPNQFGPTTTLTFNANDFHAEIALYGSDQTVAGITSTNALAVLQNSHGALGPAGASSVLTINQDFDSSYSGYIRDNTGNDAFQLGITKDGTGALTISGPNLTYTGVTTITDGTLNIDGPIGAGGNVVDADGGETNFRVSQTLAELNIGNGAVVTLGAAAPAPFAGENGGIDFDAALQPGGGAAAVPEPGTVSLLLLGALGLLGRLRNVRG